MTLNNAGLNNLATVQTTRKEPLMAEQNNSVQNNAVQTAEEQKKVYSRQQERRELDNHRQTKIERIDRLRYRAYGANGATLDFGVGEGLPTPVELLLAAIAGCSSVDDGRRHLPPLHPEVFEGARLWR